MVGIEKSELRSTSSNGFSGGGGGVSGSSGGATDEVGELGTSDSGQEGARNRRRLRSGYLAVKTRIHDEREEMLSADSTRFKEIFDNVENLHKHVQNPREQVADAEALLDITSSLLFSVKALNKEGITASDFISCLLKDFGRQNGPNGGRDSIVWKDIGAVVSHIFRSCPGCCTMIGPMDTEPKQRKTYVRRKHVRPTVRSKPGELDDTPTDERTDTDLNMLTMFNILKKNRSVRLENLVLNRNSFAQTVENLFALSFLVKDGRAEIRVNEQGYHLVSPRNAPANSAVISGEVAYCHFIFRFDYKDWELMTCSVTAGEELMPHRHLEDTSYSQQDSVSATSNNPQPKSGLKTLHVPIPTDTTPIRKISRNRGLFVREHSTAEDSSKSNDASLQKGKRKLL